jgi:hypothetical protein
MLEGVFELKTAAQEKFIGFQKISCASAKNHTSTTATQQSDPNNQWFTLSFTCCVPFENSMNLLAFLSPYCNQQPAISVEIELRVSSLSSANDSAYRS